MPLVDANVILRYLLNDHPEMSKRAEAIISEGASTTVEVLAEVVFVLRGVYKTDRSSIAAALRDLLDDITIADRACILYALRAFDETSLDFVDCVLLGYNRIEGRSIFTFDRKLNHLLEAN